MHFDVFPLLKRALTAWLMIALCAACGAAPISTSMPTAAATQAPPAPSAALPAATQAPPAPSAAASADNSTQPDDEQAVRSVVEQFGRKLQAVSLQAPPDLVAQELQQQYAPFVAPALLDAWLKDPSQAPGRVVSSPWPDHIEITNITRNSDTQYTVTGNEIEMTSVELVNGGSAGQQPVQITLEKQQGRWTITAYTHAG
jgi:hypothetical protein